MEGEVTGSMYIGGIVGKISGDVTISGCANSGEVSGRDNVGGVAGGAEDSVTAAIVATVKNCHNSGKVTGNGNNIGGVVGMSDSKCTVVDCHSSGEVSGLQTTGGVVGLNSGTVKGCYNTGEISGMVLIGGVVGSNAGGTVENCYNVGPVEGENGITGGVAGSNNGTVENCYNTGKVGGPDNTGGVVGIQSIGTCKNSYYLDTCGAEGEGTKKSSAEFRFLASTLGEDWADSVKGRPVLVDNQEADPVSADTPYEIPDAETLKAFRDFVNEGNNCKDKYFKLTANIDLDGSEGDQWTPIANQSDFEKRFKGTFDGDGRTISGLYINKKFTSYQGLFGFIDEGATVKNLTVTGSVSGMQYVGGIASHCDSNSTIENCTNNCTVNADAMGCAGGIVGSCSGGSRIVGCHNTGAIFSQDSGAGGIVGHLDGVPVLGAVASVTDCFNTGTVNGSYAGGIAGDAYEGGTVTNCYNTGMITGSIVGGIAGSVYIEVSNCYYLNTCGAAGNGTAKNETEFNSGEVAWLLQKGQETQDTQVWGQSLNDSPDEYPVLTNASEKKVYKVTFYTESDNEYAVKYTNYNGRVELPDNPTLDGAVFDHWSTVKGTSGGETFDNNTTVTGDITVYAVGRKTFGGESDEIALTTTYGTALTEDLSGHVKYESGDPATGKFTYAITANDNSLNATIDGDNLKVPADANAGTYTLTITATEKTPQYALMSVGTYGTDPVTLTVKVTVAKAEPVVTAPTGNTLSYTGEPQDLVTAGTATGGEMQYSLDKDGDYSTSIPTGTDAGSYTVWYKVVGNDNYNDVEARSVTATIGKGEADVTGSPASIIYGQDVKLTVNVAPKATNGISLASAEPDTVVFTFPKNGKTVTRTVDAAGGAVTVIIPANEVKNYFNPNMNTVTVSYGGGDNLNGDASTTISVTVMQKAAMFTFKAKDKTYDGTTAIEGTFSAMSGNVLDGDDVSVDKYTATTADPDAGYGKTVTVKIESLSGQDAAYYSIPQSRPVTAPVTISKAENTDVTPPTAESTVYDGTAQALVSGGSSTQGEMQYVLGNASYAPDDYSATVPQARDAGTYYVWYKVKGDNNHYDSAPNKVEVTIEKKPVTLTWKLDGGDNFDITYDGNAHTVTADADTGVEGENVNVTVADNTQTNVGNGYTAKATGLTDVEGADVAKNYKLPSEVTKTYSIIQATSTVTVKSNDNPTYGSDITLTATVTAAGVANSGNITGQVTFMAGTETLGTAQAENGVAMLNITGDNQKTLFDHNDVTTRYAGNANIAGGSGNTAVNVTPKALEYEVTATGKAYDGNTTVSVTLTPSNIGSDSVTLTATGNVDSADANTYSTVDLTGVTANGADAKYYSVAGSAESKALTGPVTISPKVVELAWKLDGGGTFTINYDGNEHTVTAEVTNKVGGDDVNVNVIIANDDAMVGLSGNTVTDAGKYTATAAGLTGGAGENYTLAGCATATQTIDISRVLATCEAPAAIDLTYTGKAQKLVTPGVPAGGEMMYALGENGETAPEIAFGTGLSEGIDAGTYYVWYYVRGDENHDDSGKSCVTVTIRKAPVSFEATGGAFPYDAKAHKATVTQTAGEVQIPSGGYSVVYADNGSADSTSGTPEKTEAGTYDIWVKLNNDNFKFKDENDGTREKKLGSRLTISAAPLTLAVNASPIIYGDTLSKSALEGKATLSNGTQIAGTWKWAEDVASDYPSVKDDSGKTGYTVIFTPDPEYAGNFTADSLTTSITITVNRKTLTPKVGIVASIEQFSGETATTGTLTLDGAVLGEAPTAKGTFNFDTPTAGENKTVTVTDIALSGNWGGNYVLSTTELKNQPTMASIGKRVATLEWKLNGGDGFTVTYSGSPVSVTAQVTNQVSGYGCDVTVTDGDKTDAGTYTAVAALSNTVNYALPADGTHRQSYTIEKSVVTFEEHNGTTTYNAKPHQVTLDNTVTGGAPVLTEDDYTVHYVAPGEGFDTGATDETKAGTYGVWVRLTDDVFKNYEFEDKEQTDKVGTLAVEKANLDLTIVPVTVTYGDELADTLLTGSTAKITGEGGASIPGTWAWENVGEYPAVADSELTNYTVTFTPDEPYRGNFVETTLTTTTTITVNPFMLTPLVKSVDSKTYDGNTGATGGTLTFEEAETLTGTPFNTNVPIASGSFTFTDKNVGTNKHVNVTDITISANPENYRLKKTSVDDAATSAEITAKEVTLAWRDYTGLVYSGKSVSVTAETGDFVAGDTVGLSYEDNDRIDAGTYTATASLTGEDAGNYTLAGSTQGYTIAKTEAAFTVSDNEVVYDGGTKKVTLANTNESNAPALTEGDGYTVTYGDDKADSKTDVGEYEIHIALTDGAAKNYIFADKGDDVQELTVEDGKLVITKAASTVTDVTVISADGELTYGDEFTVSTTVNAPGDITGTVTFKAGDVELGKADSVDESGKWTITVGESERDKQHAIFGDGENTVITAVYSGNGNIVGSSGINDTVTVAKKPLEYTVTGTGRVWNGETGVEVALEATNLIAGDTVTLEANGDLADGGKAGKYGKVNLSNVEIHGADAGFYATETARADVALTAEIEITKAASTAAAPAGKSGLSYTGSPLVLINAAADVDGGTAKYYVGETAPAGGAEGWRTDVYEITGLNAGTYTVWYYVDGDENHNDSEPASLTITIAPAPVSFTIGAEVKADWAAKGETNADPNPGGYVVNGAELTMTYDSYEHNANVIQTAGEAVKIDAAANNGFTVTYRKDDTGDDLTEIRDAGTYDILVNLTPTEGGIYNYAFSGENVAVHSLKIGTVTVAPYTVHVTWIHLKYVYHAHPMHADVTVQNAFKADVQPAAVPDDFDPAQGYGGKLLAFAETSGADAGEYTVVVALYGTSAGNYTVDNNTETVTIIPAPVTFTVGDNIWVVDDSGSLSRDTVTLRPVWGAVTATPDVAVHHDYPQAGTKLDLDALDVTIEYRQNGERIESPDSAGTYEVWVKIGNENYRHSATETGRFHNVGELVITDDPDSIRTYTVTFDPGYDGAPVGPAKMEKVFPNQTVVIPAASGENGDGTKYDITRPGYSFLGWSFDGRTYLPNEELHMPVEDVIFKGEWLYAVPVGGRVVQESSGGEAVPVSGATVVLKQGAEPAAETITGSDGAFDFGLVTPGIYNLEITYENGSGAKIVKTYLVEVGDSGSVENEYPLPDTALNTVVEVAPGIKSAVSMDGMIYDESAGQVYTPEDRETVADGGTVEFKMSISEATLTDEQEDEIPASIDRISLVLDLELTKTVTPKGSASQAPIPIHDSRIPVTTILHLPAEIRGKSGYTVYRFHDADGDGIEEMQAVTTSPNENGEYLKIVRDGTAIELHAEFYSTYVLTWFQDSASGGGAISYPVTLSEDTQNGGITANTRNAVPGDTVTLTVTPEEGYVLGELIVTDSTGRAVTLTDNGDGTYSFKMPNGGVTINAVFKCGGGEACPGRRFTDLDAGAWYHEYTDFVITKDLMRGVGEGLFDPSGTVTRAQMVTVLWNMRGNPVVNYYMTYSDVSEDAWYAEAIRWAASEGIADGYGNGKFGPNDTVTRQQMATMLYRYARKYGSGEFNEDRKLELTFTDAANVSDWACEAVAWCSGSEIIQGKENNIFDPAGDAKRSEMAAILTRYFKMTVK